MIDNDYELERQRARRSLRRVDVSSAACMALLLLQAATAIHYDGVVSQVAALSAGVCVAAATVCIEASLFIRSTLRRM